MGSSNICWGDCKKNVVGVYANGDVGEDGKGRIQGEGRRKGNKRAWGVYAYVGEIIKKGMGEENM